MAMISGALTAPLQDNMKRLFSPAALLTGGGSLAITGTKAGLAAMKTPAAAATQVPAVQPPPAPQASKAPNRAATSVGMPGGNTRGTFLTGPAGVDSSALSLGRNTLLGQ